jgi:hypothetical protein
VKSAISGDSWRVYGCFRSPRSLSVLSGETGHSGGVRERFAIIAIQAQRIGKQRDRCAARMLNLAAFEIPDRPHTHARPTGELVLRQATTESETGQLPTELGAATSHFLHTLASIATPLP